MSHHHDDCEICFRKTCNCNNAERRRMEREESWQNRVHNLLTYRFATDDPVQDYLVIAEGRADVVRGRDQLRSSLESYAYVAASKPHFHLHVSHFEGITL